MGRPSHLLDFLSGTARRPPSHSSTYTKTGKMTPMATESSSWIPEDVRRLRTHLGLSQAELADRIGTRQQTISEWETGASAPRRMSRRLLHLVAEESGYYTVADAAVAPHEEPTP